MGGAQKRWWWACRVSVLALPPPPLGEEEVGVLLSPPHPKPQQDGLYLSVPIFKRRHK